MWIPPQVKDRPIVNGRLHRKKIKNCERLPTHIKVSISMLKVIRINYNIIFWFQLFYGNISYQNV